MSDHGWDVVFHLGRLALFLAAIVAIAKLTSQP